ncbi:YqeG family HAD IIIA-type phosphatase [Nicoliella spurrieriana]|uniref:YqeG family HAD IIIA-type phosphatase n=1 Tax=Nicoliella spurrieriana TaxID=2925830 RepID=A0A976RRX5_9LACO|nr:YqeG family HAD IIIA-type phosphatase [Nicoliella spurrieriana]UQS86704.1 YqeG family HAD IIIA-type phosphatase [Nicoliella spurrieriana]
MIEKFKPTWMVPAIYDLKPAQLNAMGIKAVLTDLDNTVIPWNNPDGTPQLRAWLATLAQFNIRLVVISNNKRSRIQRVVQNLGLDFISRAMKPLPHGIRRAIRKYHLKNDQVIMVGDQLMTDIWASNNAHVNSVLVKPLVGSDAWITQVNRQIEKRVMNKLHQKYPDLKWQEDVKS